jgi:O-antigen ligase
VSISPFNTRGYLLASLLYLGAWLLVLFTVRSRERATRLLGALVAAGVLQAFGAVLLQSGNASYQLFLTTFDPMGRATGTFPSPDNLAGYMELCLAAGLGWLLSQMGKGAKTGEGWRARTVSVLTFVMSGKMLLRLLLVVMVIALVMSHSRMGNGAFFIGLALTGAAVAIASSELRKPALWLVASMVLVDIIIIGQWVGIDRVVQRMQDTAVLTSPQADSFGLSTAPVQREETLEQRFTIPRMSLGLVASSPWFGHGGGTYYTAFPPFKQPGLGSIGMLWDHAHNDYVQVAADTGWVGLALWMLVGLATAWRAAQLLADGETRVNRGFGVAAVMALFCMGLHNLVDFNMHIPSNALTFTVLLAAVWAMTERPGRQRAAA